MQKWIFTAALTGLCTFAGAQTFQVFKGDTINWRDKAGLKQGIWRKYYSTDTLCSESAFKNGRHVGSFKTWYKSGKLQSNLVYRGLTEVSFATIYHEDGSTVKAKGKYTTRSRTAPGLIL